MQEKEMLLMDDIIREGNSLLKEKSQNVNLPLSEEDEHIINLMIDYIFNSIDEEISEKYKLRPAVGLAAPQIGILKKMIVIYAFDEDGNEHFYPLINPVLLSYSNELTYLKGGEGCLSVDRDVRGLIHRPKRISVRAQYYDVETGKVEEKIFKFEGYISVVFQHEFDHLKGILFVDRINKENPFFVPENSTPIKFND